ncbi:MAG: stage III sporulation protein AF [Firmicutes bacterium]|nr:stage III sporulation protein AF [Bacillota bacterium]
MQTLYELVRKLILLAILAGFFELLLPSNTFKTYCRLVVGLLILAMLLQPVMDLLGQGWNPEQFLADSELGLTISTYPENGEDQLGSLDAQEMVEQQLAQQLTPTVNRRYPGTETRVRLDLELDEHGNMVAVNSLAVLIAPKTGGAFAIESVRIGGEDSRDYLELANDDLIFALAERVDLPVESVSLYMHSELERQFTESDQTN